MREQTAGRSDPGAGADSTPDTPAGAGFRVTAPAVTLPTGGGAIRGIGETFATNPATGSGAVTVPIFASPARAGLSPRLSLSYDSAGGNSAFGFGWRFDLPAVTRRTDRGLPRYADAESSDVFLLSGSEELVPVLDPAGAPDVRIRRLDGPAYEVRAYRPRVEASFARVERWTRVDDAAEVCWRSISAENVTTWYGRTPDSRIADPGDPGRVYSWLISHSHDDKGNVIAYGYKAEDSAGVPESTHERHRTGAGRAANRYPKRIRYGNRTPYRTDPAVARIPELPTDWCFELVFDYGEHDEAAPLPEDERRPWPCRADPFSTYRPAFELRTYRLCRRILMFHHFPDAPGVGRACLVRSTDLVHADPDEADPARPFYSLLGSITQTGYRRTGPASYASRSFPAVEFDYSEAAIDAQVRRPEPETLENLPAGLDGAGYRWVDLDGEGTGGVLSAQDGRWHYRSNLSPATTADRPVFRLAPIASVPRLPSMVRAPGASAQLLDLTGNGRRDLVAFDGPAPGYAERTGDGDWADFRPFPSLPVLDWHDPDLTFADLTGDGLPDLLISEDGALRWHRSLAADGFGPAEPANVAPDEERGPRVVFADPSRSVFLADMSGDGLTDIVRVRNGEVCYWPNLGYGRFGAKVTMDGAPTFARPDLFDARRLRLADIDGSGTADLVYLGADGVRIHLNLSGNGFGERRDLDPGGALDGVADAQLVDLLGTGTACLVWSSPLPADGRDPLRYVDLMSAGKPHLLVRVRNNLGAETRIRYAPSTRYFVADELAGTPWATRLPFPVQVVERVEQLDLVSGNRFVTRYTYHHGYFDGVEREFRGFGRVERTDTEEFGVFTAGGVVPGPAGEPAPATNVDAASHVPPVLTRTWFHTGAYAAGDRLSRRFATEYYRESDADGEADAMLLPDTVLPDDLTAEEAREAVRALKGSILREESYALDGTEAAGRPYTVAERNYMVRRLQASGPNPHAVFSVHARESVEFSYERARYEVGGRLLADPRVTHRVVLAVDDFGGELRSVAVAYGRRLDPRDPMLRPEDLARQRRTIVVCTDTDYTDPVRLDGAYRTPVAAQSRSYELIRVTPDGAVPGITNLFRFDELAAKVALAADGRHDLPFEDADGAGAVQEHPYRRLVEQVRTLYRADDLSGPLSLGRLEPGALVSERYKLALTPGLLEVFRRDGVPLLPDPAAVLAGEGGYASGDELAAAGAFPPSDPPGQWWLPSGRVFHSAGPADSPAAELAEARAHFYLPRRFVDQFGNPHLIRYDAEDLLILETEDALGNRVTAGERGGDGAPVNRNDYRVLRPALVTDPNGNRGEVAFDTLGMVCGVALMGRPGEALGDSLEGFAADPAPAEVGRFLADPGGPAAAGLLAGAGVRVVYDLSAVPVVAASIAREMHAADLRGGERSALQVSVSYSDGFGRQIQQKRQAEPGPVVDGGPDVAARWTATGWTVFNNKGLPVRQYEPFFDDTLAFRPGNRAGMSPTLLYDPVGRTVAVLRPDHAWQKTVVDPWRTETWDVNDTVLIADPGLDLDVGAYLRRLPGTEYLPTWHGRRIDGALGPDELDAARKAATHAGTPAMAYLDALGRTFLSLAGNGPAPADQVRSLVELDVQGHQRAVVDALDRPVLTYRHDLLGNLLHSASADAGERWTLTNTAGHPIRHWDRRDHEMRQQYDALLRPLELFVRTGSSGTERLAERVNYGESASGADGSNLRGRVFQRLDAAGVATIGRYDFKGNPLDVTHRLVRDHRAEADWSAAPELDGDSFTTRTGYDALNRPVVVTTPDGSVTRREYNAAGLLTRLSAILPGATEATTFLARAGYNAKGQRETVEHGNGAVRGYEYDPQTFRLRRLVTTRAADGARLQDLGYAYDPSGNVTRIGDQAQQTVFFAGQVVTATRGYTYDPLYRLVRATGREHIGQVSEPQPTFDDGPRSHLPLPTDGQAMRGYTEDYRYDPAGNLVAVAHTAGSSGSWTRGYRYEEPATNRLTGSTVNGVIERYEYDAHGNTVRMPHLPVLEWDHADRLRVTGRQVTGGGPGERTFYLHDGAGQRARKVTERANGTRRAERLYVAGVEVYREYDGSGTGVVLERRTLPVNDDEGRIALVETRTAGAERDVPPLLVRYQVGNHLGSAVLELDDTARIITYEEYYPYGCTSYQAGRSVAEVGLKRYRFTGKERDEETGFTRHGLRYYAAWLGRWVSPDPSGPVDGPSLYPYARDNPVRMTDHTGGYSVDQFAADVGRVNKALAATNPGMLLAERTAETVTAVATGKVSATEVVDNALIGNIPGVGTLINLRQGLQETKRLATAAGAASERGDTAGAVRGYVDAAIALEETVTSTAADVATASLAPDVPRVHASAGISPKVAAALEEAGTKPAAVRVAAEPPAKPPGTAPKAAVGAAASKPVPAPVPEITPPERQLTAGGPTTLTKEQVARARGDSNARGFVGERHTAELQGGSTGKQRTETPLGPRFHDVTGIRLSNGTDLRIESKNYLRFRGAGSGPRTVPATAEILTQVRKDAAWVREGAQIGESRLAMWDFHGAPPSPELARALQEHGIPYTEIVTQPRR